MVSDYACSLSGLALTRRSPPPSLHGQRREDIDAAIGAPSPLRPKCWRQIEKRVLGDQFDAAANEIRGQSGNESKKVDHGSSLTPSARMAFVARTSPRRGKSARISRTRKRAERSGSQRGS
jgi:hypothetical protein